MFLCEGTFSKHKMTSVEGIHDHFAVQAYDSSGMCIHMILSR